MPLSSPFANKPMALTRTAYNDLAVLQFWHYNKGTHTTDILIQFLD